MMVMRPIQPLDLPDWQLNGQTWVDSWAKSWYTITHFHIEKQTTGNCFFITSSFFSFWVDWSIFQFQSCSAFDCFCLPTHAVTALGWWLVFVPLFDNFNIHFMMDSELEKSKKDLVSFVMHTFCRGQRVNKQTITAISGCFNISDSLEISLNAITKMKLFFVMYVTWCSYFCFLSL